MALSQELTLDIISASLSGTIIFFRCSYRLLSRCRVHSACHRTWHADDAYMALAILPLVARSTCISMSFVLNPAQTFGLASESDAAAAGMSVDQLNRRWVVSRQLLLPGRTFYFIFLWVLKLCLLNFYARFMDIFTWGRRSVRVLWWTIIATSGAILVPTLAECRPMDRFWLPDPDNLYPCHHALGNLVTMAVCNIITDVALIVMPFPVLRQSTLTTRQKFELGILFSVGLLVVSITVLRLPLILDASVSQAARSRWASVEILCACIVANAAFYYALLKDLQRGHDSRFTTSEPTRDDVYLQRVQSADQTGGRGIEGPGGKDPW